MQFIQTQNGDYVKAETISFVYSDKNEICCVSGHAPRIVLGKYSAAVIEAEKQNLIKILKTKEVCSDYTMPDYH